MQISKTSENGKLTLFVDGRLDTNTAQYLEAELQLDGITEVVLDFANLEYISSAGLRVLLTAKKAMMSCGGSISVLNANEPVRDVFDITGCSEMFNMG
jgi:anti-sigma B factor antagonist